MGRGRAEGSGRRKKGGEAGNEGGELGSNSAVNFLFLFWCGAVRCGTSSWLSCGSLWIRGPQIQEQTVPLCFNFFWLEDAGLRMYWWRLDRAVVESCGRVPWLAQHGDQYGAVRRAVRGEQQAEWGRATRGWLLYRMMHAQIYPLFKRPLLTQLIADFLGFLFH